MPYREEVMDQIVKNKGNVCVIIPCVVAHNLDPHTGIPFMPHMGAHVAGALDEAGHNVQVIDCFGLQYSYRRIIGEFMLMGVDENWVVEHLDEGTKAVFIYCRTVEEFISVERLAQTLKEKRPDLPICLFENIQTVNSFSLKEIVEELFNFGAEYAVFGEPERTIGEIADCIISKQSVEHIPGMAFKKDGEVFFTPKAELEKNLDDLPFPLWEKFPLEGYWKAGFAHAPIDGRKFLPLLTSRGCPFKCTFCISPSLNPTWRSRSAKDVVDEMEYFYRTLGVEDFHISDLDPTVSEKRNREICYELISRGLPLTWKVAQGTKIETIKREETLELMKKAGCTFLSFSPESGSSRMLKIMKKPFNHEHALQMLRKMNQVGIRTQACFVAGVPGEMEADRKQSIEYVKKLVKSGIDEIAVTIFTPLPGAELSKAIEGFTHYSQLTHSPTWRKDYKEVLYYRNRMYLTFFLYKFLYRPDKVLREIRGFLTGKFETKMEMSFFKIIKLRLIYFVPNLFASLQPEKIIKQLGTLGRLRLRQRNVETDRVSDYELKDDLCKKQITLGP